MSYLLVMVLLGRYSWSDEDNVLIVLGTSTFPFV